jgi:adenine phosphoribosyltransferase
VESLRAFVRDVPDFPEAGIVFRDITPLLADGAAFAAVVRALAEPFRDERIDLVAGIESRGFLLGAPLALELGAGFVPIRKAGRLPGRTIAREYSLEYGANRLELHADAVAPGQRVLLVDDVLATGGTARAGLELLEELGGEVVGTAFLIELTGLAGRALLGGCRLVSLLHY